MRWPTCTFCSIHILLSISWKKVISGWFSNLRHFGQLQFIDFLTKITLRDILLLKKSCWIRKSYFAVLNRIIDEDRWKSGHFPKKANPWFSVKNGFPMSTKNYKYRALDGIVRAPSQHTSRPKIRVNYSFFQRNLWILFKSLQFPLILGREVCCADQ